MLKIIKPSPDRIDITLNGTLDADEMRKGLDDFVAKSADVKDGVMFYTITDFSFPTLAAIGVEIARLPQLISTIGRFRRCAVLSDIAWLRKAADIEGAVIPGLEIKSFELDEAAAAEAWLEPYA